MNEGWLWITDFAASGSLKLSKRCHRLIICSRELVRSHRLHSSKLTCLDVIFEYVLRQARKSNDKKKARWWSFGNLFSRKGDGYLFGALLNYLSGLLVWTRPVSETKSHDSSSNSSDSRIFALTTCMLTPHILPSTTDSKWWHAVSGCFFLCHLVCLAYVQRLEREHRYLRNDRDSYVDFEKQAQQSCLDRLDRLTSNECSEFITIF